MLRSSGPRPRAPLARRPRRWLPLAAALLVTYALGACGGDTTDPNPNPNPNPNPGPGSGLGSVNGLWDAKAPVSRARYPEGPPAAAPPPGSCPSTPLPDSAANCLYLIRAEQRFGDGDGVFTLAEQSRAVNALYDVTRGQQALTGPGRRARLGIEITF